MSQPTAESVPCGFDEVNGFGYVLDGRRWPKLDLTYSFAPDGTATSFGPSSWFAHLAKTTTEAQWRAAVRRIFDTVSRHCPLDFREVPDGGAAAGSAGGHGDIRFFAAGPRAGSNAAAWAYYPSGTQLGGDCFLHTIHRHACDVPGVLDVYSVLLHEVGHALGIKHSDKSPAVMAPTIGFGPVYGDYFPDDIAALQALYGERPLPPPPENTGAAFVREARAGGDWREVAGSQGYALAGSRADAQGKPFTLKGGQTWTWAAKTADPRALAVPGADRVAACWYNATPWEIVLPELAAPTDVTLYLLDWDRNGRRQRVEVLDWGGAVLDGRDAGDFAGGLYLTYRLAGGCKFRFTKLAGVNAVVSGLFYGGPPAPPVVPCPFEVLPDGRTLRALWSEPVRGAAVAGGLSVSADGERVPLSTPPAADPSHALAWTAETPIRKGQRVAVSFAADPLAPVTSVSGGVLGSFESIAANRSEVE